MNEASALGTSWSRAHRQAHAAAAVAEAIFESGIRRAVLSPGSRSTPLAIALSRLGAFDIDVVVDERSAAFFALGQVRASGEPTLLVCTSGTAPAHYFPAVIEAFEDGLPLVVISADRPLSLQGTGAAQTIDQIHLYGDFVSAFRELGSALEYCTTADITCRGLKSQIRTLVQAATGIRPGPVHANLRFEKPLEPPSDFVVASGRGPQAEMPLAAPLPQVVRSVADKDLAWVDGLIRDAKRPLIIAGPMPRMSEEDRSAIVAMWNRWGAPVAAELASQCRVPQAEVEYRALRAFNVLFEKKGTELFPDLIIQLGRYPTTKGLQRLCGESAEGQRAARVVISVAASDPDHTALAHIAVEPSEFARAYARWFDSVRSGVSGWRMMDRLESKSVPFGVTSSTWLSEADERAASVVDDYVLRFRSDAANAEGPWVSEILRALPIGSQVVLGNSLPIRHADAFTTDGLSLRKVLTQRGANGIDGFIAGAAGAASVHDGLTVAIVGDVAFLHDVGSLLTARSVLDRRRGQSRLVIIAVNNDGGRIFEQLPVGGRSDLEAQMPSFTTPHGYSCAALARGFGIAASTLKAPNEIVHCLEASAPSCLSVVEVEVPQHAAREERESIFRALEAKLPAREPRHARPLYPVSMKVAR